MAYKQASPKTWRPWPPVEDAMNRLGNVVWSREINLLLAEKLGIPPQKLEKYLKEEK